MHGDVTLQTVVAMLRSERCEKKKDIPVVLLLSTFFSHCFYAVNRRNRVSETLSVDVKEGLQSVPDP